MREIYEIEDKSECYNPKTKLAVPYLSFDKPEGDAKLISKGGKNATGEALAELCDHDAENKNKHDFVGVHESLLGLLSSRHGSKLAKIIMLEIAKEGGLHEMAQ